MLALFRACAHHAVLHGLTPDEVRQAVEEGLRR